MLTDEWGDRKMKDGKIGMIDVSPSMRPFVDAADRPDRGGSPVFDTGGPQRGQIV